MSTRSRPPMSSMSLMTSITPEVIDTCLRRARVERSEAFATLGRDLWAVLAGPRDGKRRRRRARSGVRSLPAVRA